MDGFEWNKIIGAILGTMLFVTALGFIAEAIYSPIEGRGVGYSLPGAEEQTAEGGETPTVEVTPLPVLLADASADAGARQARKCTACHSFEEGGGNKVGPALWNVVGRPKASIADFSYSDAFQAMGATGDTWTYEALNEYLMSPREMVPGTKMTFAGLPSPEDRADLLAYLQTLSPNPVPFPAPATEAPPAATEEPATAEAAPAEPAPAEEPMAEAPAASGDDLAARLAAASVDAGAAAARTCQACHSLDEGGPNKVGPPLWGVVGRAAGTRDYAYSPAFKELAAQGIEWSFAELDQYLTAPRDFAPGTRMTLATASPERRADILVYLATLNSPPVPLPGAAAASGDSGMADEAMAGDAAMSEADEAVAARVAAASAEAGQALTRRCLPCHSLTEGGPIKVGPPIFGVVGRQAGTMDYPYSEPFQGLRDSGLTWSLAELDRYLTDPQVYVPGTKMVLALASPDDRANVLAFLSTLVSETPAGEETGGAASTGDTATPVTQEALAAVAPGIASGEPMIDEGRTIFEKTAGDVGCQLCHGMEAAGDPDGGGPYIRGVSIAQVNSALDGGVPVMNFIKLDPHQREAVVAYLKYLSTAQEVTQGPTEALGQLVFEKTAGGVGCIACHGEGATGDIGPDIRGKDPVAVLQALSTVEEMDFIDLTPEEILAVADYLRYLHEAEAH